MAEFDDLQAIADIPDGSEIVIQPASGPPRRITKANFLAAMRTFVLTAIIGGANITITRGTGQITIAGASGGVTVAQVLAQIMSGTGIEIDTSTAGQITISATGAAIAVQDEGTVLDASPSAINFTGAGVTATAADGTITVNIPGGEAPTPTSDMLMGTSDDETPQAAELTIMAPQGVGTIPAYTGSKRLLIARIATEADITSVLFSNDDSNTNQVGAFTKFTSTIEVGGTAYNVWVGNQPVTNMSDVTITVT